MILNAEECRRILGVPADATEETIRQVYRDLVRVWHPDRFQSDERLRQIAQDNLRKINDAYAALKDRPTAAGSYGPSQSRTAEARAGARPAAGGYGPSQSRTAEARAGARPAAGPGASTATEDAPPKAAPCSFAQPAARRHWARAIAVAVCCAGPVWAVVQMVALLRVPALDANLSLQPRILTPMRSIDPALGVRGAAETLVVWSHGDLVDLWKPAQPAALRPAANLQTVAAGRKPGVGGRARTAKRPPPAMEVQPAPASGSDLIGPGPLSGAGELRLANQTDLEAVVKLVNRNGAMVRALYIAPHGSASIRSIAIGVYTVFVDLGRDLDAAHLRFLNERSTPAPLGPFQFMEVTSDKGVSGSRFEVALKPR
jgi:hypothetical protein